MRGVDYAVLLLYLLAMVIVGVWFGRRNTDTAEMFTAGARSPWWMSGLSGFMTMFSAGTFVVWGGIAFRLGVVAIAINLCYGVAALLAGAIVAGRWKRLGVKTPAEYIELRFGRGPLHFYTWTMMVFRVVGGGVALYSMALVLVRCMPLAEGNPLRDPSTGNLSLPLAIALFGAVVSLYTMIGGLWGVLMTDVIQFVILNLAVVFLVLLAAAQPIDWGAAIATAPEGFFSPTAPTEGYAAFFLCGWVVLHFFVIGAEWAFVQRYLCVRDERDARRSAFLFGALYLISPFLWLMPPLLHRLRHPIDGAVSAGQLTRASESAYIDACLDLLPAGMVGLMVAAMFSATASMISSQLNVFAGVFTNDVYRRWAPEGCSESHLLWVGRLFTALLGAAFTGVALSVPYLGGAERVVITATTLVVTPLLAPSLMGLFSRRLNSAAVWWTASVSVLIGLIGKFGFTDVADTSPAWRHSIASWIAGNPKTFDLLLGLVLPLTVLAALHAVTRGIAPGWLRLDWLSLNTIAGGEAPAADDYGPASTVAWSVLLGGVLVALLAAIKSESRLMLLAFSCALIVSGALLQIACSRAARRFRQGNFHANV